MTLSTETTKVQYSGNDSTTEFAVTFNYWDDADLRVILLDAGGTETVQTITTHYTLVGGGGGPGTLTMVTAPATGETLTIKSDISDVQNTSFPLGGKFPSTSVEEQFDKTVRMVQQKDELLSRVLLLSESATGGPYTLPEPSANQVLAWNSAGTDLENKAPLDATVDNLTVQVQLLAQPSATGTTAGTDADEIVIDNASTDAGLTILTPSTGTGRIVFGDNIATNQGIIAYAHASNSLTLSTAGTALMQMSISRVDVNHAENGCDFRARSNLSQNMFLVDADADRVGIGLSDLAPTDGVLHIQSATAGAVAAHADADELVLENSTNTGLTILAGTTGLSSVAFGDSGDNDQGLIQYNHTGNYLSLTGNAVEGIRISTSEVEINPGNLANPDLRVNSDTSTSMFVVDAGANRVGISNTSVEPTDGVLHIQSASAGVVSANTFGDELVIEGTGAIGMSFLSPNSGSSADIYFGDTDDNIIGNIGYSHMSDLMYFAANNNLFRLEQGLISFNHSMNDHDFRMASDAKQNCFIIDAGTSNVHINNATNTTTSSSHLHIGIGTSPTATLANGITLGAKDSSAGATDATLEMWLETAPIAVGTFTPSHKFPIWINGTEYHIQLDAV